MTTDTIPADAARQAANYTRRLLALAEQLQSGEAIAIPRVDLVIARSSTGTLRLADCPGWVTLNWRLGDIAYMIRGWLEERINWTINGHWAADYRQHLDAFLERPHATQVSGVGRRGARLHGFARPLETPEVDR